MVLEENNDHLMPNEETIEIESATELELVASLQNPFLLSKEVVSHFLSMICAFGQ